MTKEETTVLIQQLRKVFDMVRLVDVSSGTQFGLDEAGNIVSSPHQCYAVWKKHKRCENCISAKAYAKRGKLTKFEFVENEIYYVIAMYIEVEDISYVMEMVSKVSDETLFATYGEGKFIEAITNYNKKLFIDSMTGVYNRLYYDEQLLELNSQAVAVADMDNFKMINDTYGHIAGDEALKSVAAVIKLCVQCTDAVVRYGGDEFVIVFGAGTRESIGGILEEIRRKVSEIVLEKYPQIRLSVSMGGKYSKKKTKELFQEADQILYRAKKDKNNVKFED